MDAISDAKGYSFQGIEAVSRLGLVLRIQAYAHLGLDASALANRNSSSKCQ